MSNALTRKIESIESKGGIRSIDIANILGTTPETVSRWNQGKAFPHPEKERILLDLEYIVDLLSDFYEPMETRLWLYQRQKLLNGQRPADLIQNEQTDEVLKILDQLRDGVYL